MSSSQLTHIFFFRGVGLNHQPDIVFFSKRNGIWVISQHFADGIPLSHMFCTSSEFPGLSPVRQADVWSTLAGRMSVDWSRVYVSWFAWHGERRPQSENP